MASGEYIAIPATGAGPGVLVLHAWWGLTDVFRRACDRLAEAGFVARENDLQLCLSGWCRFEKSADLRILDPTLHLQIIDFVKRRQDYATQSRIGFKIEVTEEPLDPRIGLIVGAIDDGYRAD